MRRSRNLIPALARFAATASGASLTTGVVLVALGAAKGMTIVALLGAVLWSAGAGLRFARIETRHRSWTDERDRARSELRRVQADLEAQRDELRRLREVASAARLPGLAAEVSDLADAVERAGHRHDETSARIDELVRSHDATSDRVDHLAAELDGVADSVAVLHRRRAWTSTRREQGGGGELKLSDAFEALSRTEGPAAG